MAEFQSAIDRLPSRPLSLADAINIALQQNPAIVRAQKDLQATQGVVIQTRAIAMPKIDVAGNYRAVQESDVDSPPQIAPDFTFGTEQSWQTQIRLVQSIYEGGRIQSSLRAAKLMREQSLLNYQAVVADSVLEVRVVYLDALLAAQQIVVQQASIDLLKQQLADTNRRFEAGTVPKFNVLRAEVELANAQPKLIRARNSFRIGKSRLATLLGYDIPPGTSEEIPLTLADKLEAESWGMDLSRAIAMALERRPELGALRAARALRKEDLVSAKAGYLPGLQAFFGYDAHSSMFSTDLTDDVHGWITGVQLSWDIFDGGLTRGKAMQAQALYDRAGVEVADAGRRIELDVRTGFSNFVEAREVLESQKKVLEQAEEALRLANARYEAGTGTQLEVLSAQTALTDARTMQIQAVRDYAVARARLERATGVNFAQNLDKR